MLAAIRQTSRSLVRSPGLTVAAIANEAFMRAFTSWGGRPARLSPGVSPGDETTGQDARPVRAGRPPHFLRVRIFCERCDAFTIGGVTAAIGLYGSLTFLIGQRRHAAGADIQQLLTD